MDAYYPKLYLVRYKNSGAKRGKGKDFTDAKELTQTVAPMVPGVLFIKCKMNPEIAVRQPFSILFLHDVDIRDSRVCIGRLRSHPRCAVLGQE